MHYIYQNYYKLTLLLGARPQTPINYHNSLINHLSNFLVGDSAVLPIFNTKGVVQWKQISFVVFCSDTMETGSNMKFVWPRNVSTILLYSPGVPHVFSSNITAFPPQMQNVPSSSSVLNVLPSTSSMIDNTQTMLQFPNVHQNVHAGLMSHQVSLDGVAVSLATLRWRCSSQCISDRQSKCADTS